MNIDYHHKYLKYKTKYLEFHNQHNLSQDGGGSWNYFSFDNDQTHDALTKFRIEGVYFDNDKIIKILKKMFDKYFEDLKLDDDSIKLIQFSDYINDDPETDFYLSGVVVYLLIRGYTIPIKYLKFSLIY